MAIQNVFRRVQKPALSIKNIQAVLLILGIAASEHFHIYFVVLLLRRCMDDFHKDWPIQTFFAHQQW